MYWKRKYRINFPELGLELNNLDDEQDALTISFEINKDITQESNKAKLTILNLSDETISKIEKADTKVEFYAGYKENGGAIHAFSGSVIESVTKDDGSDVITNAKSTDTVNLYDVSLTDITSYNYVGNSIQIGLNSGGNLQVNSAENLSSVFQIAEGNFQYNHGTGEWQLA